MYQKDFLDQVRAQLTVKEDPAKLRERVFERFVQGGKTGIKGVGLGLAIVRRIADLHGGRAWVEDDPAGGCAFFLEFPRYCGSSSSSNPK